MDCYKLFNEIDNLYPHKINDGDCSQIVSQIDKLKEIMNQMNPKNILEIGFGLGKSSLLFLSHSNANVYSFDLFDQEYHKIGKKYIEEIFPNRHLLIAGDSFYTLDNFIENNTNLKFDMIFIDGGRNNIPYSDLSKCSFLSDKNTMIILNNYVKKPENYAFWNDGFNNAWNKMLQNKYVYEIEQFDYFFGRGMVLGHYNFSENGDSLCKINQYKNMNKNELYNIATHFYSNHKFNKTREICELYLSYFEKIKDKYTLQMMFYYAIIEKNDNPTKTIQLLENLLTNNDNLDQTLKKNIEDILREKYPKSEFDEIPKIIHLLFFGETEFMSYHYKCIKSMIDNMPNHQIIIYNNIEPIGNKYWENIIKYPSVKIEKLIPPSSFDGFDLKHFQYKADVVRIEKLYEYGGIYLDIDMLIFKNFESIFQSKHDFYISKENSENDGLINAFIASKPKNEFLKIWLDSFKTGLRMDIWAYHIRDANSILLKENPHFYIKYNICILNAEEFFSIPWTNKSSFENMNSSTKHPENVYGIHLFETILHHTLINSSYFNEKIPITMPLPMTSLSKTKLNSFVDGVVVLSLKERPEKNQYMQDHLNSFGIEHKIILNELHAHPCIGCFESHIGAIKYAKENKLKNILIFEDDAFIQNIDGLNNLSSELPPHWDMLYLGGILTKSIFNTGKWVRGTFWCNHAYIVNSNMYDIILNRFSECDIAEYAQKKETIDHFYTKLFHDEFNCFLHVDQLVIQKEGYSDLSNKNKWTNFNWATYSMKCLSDL